MKIIRDSSTLNSTAFADLLTALNTDLTPQDTKVCYIQKNNIRIKPKGQKNFNFEITETLQPLVDALL